MINILTSRVRAFYTLAIMALAAVTSAFGQIVIPPKPLNRLHDIVAAELKGLTTAPVGNATVKRILAYEGTALTSDFEFTYQIFPALGLYRILPTRQAAPSGWLYMSSGKVDIGEAVKITEDGTCILDGGLHDRILSCVSGVLYRDVSMAKLSCRQIPKHYLYTQEARAFVSGVLAVQILVDPQHEAIAVNSSNHWASATQGEAP